MYLFIIHCDITNSLLCVYFPRMHTKVTIVSSSVVPSHPITGSFYEVEKVEWVLLISTHTTQIYQPSHHHHHPKIHAHTKLLVVVSSMAIFNLDVYILNECLEVLFVCLDKEEVLR